MRIESSPMPACAADAAEPTSDGFLRRYGGLIAAVLIAATLQAVISARAYSIHVDGLTFIAIAQELSRDPLETIRIRDQHPGYPALILALATALRPVAGWSEPELWTHAALMASGICGILSVVVMWLFARRLFDVRVANIAAIAFAVLPLFRMIASDALSDTEHLFFYVLAAWLAAEGFARQQARWFAAAGAASGLAFWVRPEGLEIALIAGLLLGIQFVFGRRLRAGVALAAVACTSLLVVGAYVGVAGKITSKQLPWAKKRAQPIFVIEESQAAVRAEQKAAAAASPAAPPPAVAPAVIHKRVVARVAWKAIHNFIKNIVWGFRYVFLPLYLIGNVELYRRRPAWWVWNFPLWVGVLHFVVLCGVYFISGYIDQRHVMPLIALAMPFAALGVIWVGDKLAGLLAPRFSPRTCVAVVAVASCLIVVPRTLVPMNPELQAVFVATHWVQQQSHGGDAVISNSPYIAFYAQLPGADLNPETTTVDAAVAQLPGGANFEFAVLDTQIIGYRPEWKEQLERNCSEVFRLVDPRSGRDETKVLVYRNRHAAERVTDATEPQAEVQHVSSLPKDANR